jgi:hypothetical protein
VQINAMQERCLLDNTICHKIFERSAFVVIAGPALMVSVRSMLQTALIPRPLDLRHSEMAAIPSPMDL